MSTLINDINNIYPNTSNWALNWIGPVTLSSSDLNNLSTTPKLIISSPGSGFANIPIYVICETSATGTAYPGSSTANITNSSGTTSANGTIFLAVNGGGALINGNTLSVTGATIATYSILNNQGTYLLAPGLGSGGTQTCQVWMRYYILPLV